MIWSKFEKSRIFIKKYIAHKPPLGSSKSLETDFSDIRGLPRTPGIPVQKLCFLHNISKTSWKVKFLVFGPGAYRKSVSRPPANAELNFSMVFFFHWFSFSRMLIGADLLLFCFRRFGNLRLHAPCFFVPEIWQYTISSTRDPTLRHGWTTGLGA